MDALNEPKGNRTEMRTDIDSRINEAEVCRSMGLFVEALAIYEKVLPAVAPHQSELQETIKNRITLMKQEVAKEEGTAVPGMSPKDLSFIRNAISGSGDLSAIVDSASAFQEMGLLSEAVAEYAKLFGEDYPAEKLAPPLVECLLKLHPPANAVSELESLLRVDDGFDKIKAARIKYLVGLENVPGRPRNGETRSSRPRPRPVQVRPRAAPGRPGDRQTPGIGDGRLCLRL